MTIPFWLEPGDPWPGQLLLFLLVLLVRAMAPMAGASTSHSPIVTTIAVT
jgi:hypothetical protein